MAKAEKVERSQQMLKVEIERLKQLRINLSTEHLKDTSALLDQIALAEEANQELNTKLSSI